MTDTDDLRERVSLVDIIGRTVELRRSGDQWTGRCPFHEDRHASLSVSERLFHCHAAGCGKSGDVFSWLELTEGLEFPQAKQRVRQMMGLPESPQNRRNGRGAAPMAVSSPAAPAALPRSLAEDFHEALSPERRAYYHNRGLSDETIDHFLLGWDGTRYTIPVFVGGELVNVRRRKDDASRQDRGPKMLNTTGHGAAVVYNQDVLAGAESVIVAEGEFDTMVLVQHGWTAVCSTGGAGTFKPEWVPLFSDCQTVYVCYDHDLAGRSGAAKVAALFGERARVVELPDEVGEAGDVTDWFATLGRTDADFEALLQSASPYQSEPEAQEQPQPVHLSQSAAADLVGKLVSTRVLVAGKMDAPYIVPAEVRYTCFANDRERDICGASADSEKAGGFWDRTLSEKESTYLDLCARPAESLGRVLRGNAGCHPACKKFSYQVLRYANLEAILAVPMADRVLPGAGTSGEVDESGNEYVARNLYILNDKATVNQYYQMTGRVFPQPKDQLATILISEMAPLQDNISQFQLTDEVRALFGVFQPHGGDLVEHVNTLLQDLTDNVTRIYKRDEALLAVLLAYHSVLGFVFEGRPVRRGWVEVLLLGDTGLGKTEMTRSLMDFCGLGALVSSETARRTGLTYSVQQVGDRWFVKWGKYVLADRRLLAVDELSELPEDDLGQMTQGRNDGVIRVDRAGAGEANCRTRLIWMSNAKGRKGLYDFSHGVEALKSLFPTPADLRRLDMAVFLSAKDIDLAEINTMRRPPERQLVSAEALKQSVLWSWSRRQDDVVIDEAATEAILREASRLSEIYGAAEDIPLVSPADMRTKLARLSVALAALVHSTDESHRQVIVRPQHARFIGLYLDSIYQARNCRYHTYAGYAMLKSRLDETEISDISMEMKALDGAQGEAVGSNVSASILALYRHHDVLNCTEISELLDIDRRTVTKRLTVFRKHALITRVRGGYQKTQKFVEYLFQSPRED